MTLPIIYSCMLILALTSLPTFHFGERKVGLLVSLACCVLCVPVNLLYHLTKIHATWYQRHTTTCHPNDIHTYFPMTSDDTAAMQTCQMGVPVQVHQGSCIMDGNRCSESVFLLLRQLSVHCKIMASLLKKLFF
jgi:hypothetical protein